jgi:antirestriction protein ArdC
MSFGIYETVTNRIIAELEAGAIPWTQPWKNQKSGGVMPLNRATGRPYSGINIPILWGAASAFGYPTHQWLTFKQALDMKACVKKGEKGTQVVFTKRIPRDDDDEHGTISMLKTFYVFNVQQIDGLERIPTPELVDIDEGDVNQLADRSEGNQRVIANKARKRPCQRCGTARGAAPRRPSALWPLWSQNVCSLWRQGGTISAGVLS